MRGVFLDFIMEFCKKINFTKRILDSSYLVAGPLVMITTSSRESNCPKKCTSFEVIHLTKKMLQPHAVIAAYFNNKSIPESTYESVMSFFFLYIFTFASSALLLSFSGLDFLTCISAAASAISNVGPGLGDIIGPEGNYSALSDYSKTILTVTMFLGRLEMLTILILFLPSFWKN